MLQAPQPATAPCSPAARDGGEGGWDGDGEGGVVQSCVSSKPCCCRSTASSSEGLAILALQPQKTLAVLTGLAKTDLASPPQSRGLFLLLYLLSLQSREAGSCHPRCDLRNVEAQELPPKAVLSTVL